MSSYDPTRYEIDYEGLAKREAICRERGFHTHGLSTPDPRTRCYTCSRILSEIQEEEGDTFTLRPHQDRFVDS